MTKLSSAQKPFHFVLCIPSPFILPAREVTEIQRGHVHCRGHTAKQVVGWELSLWSQPPHWPPPTRLSVLNNL